MTLEDYWPVADEDHCKSCLFNEAESAAEAVLLAVHQPMLLTKREDEGLEQPVNEAQVLEALLAPHPSGTTIIPIIGDSGVGKSHLIRWLDSHLKLRGDASSRHVVRIPKSASLRKVLELILEGLPETHDYNRIRDQLQGAQMPAELDQATQSLQANLLVELERKATEANARIGRQTAVERDLQDSMHCSRQQLQSLLGDPAILPHFINADPNATGVLTRIADRFLHGAGGNDTGPTNQFKLEDFAFLQNVEIGQLAAPTRLYLPILKDALKLQNAIRCLNDVIDQAVGKLVAFAGTVSLSEVFLDIRRQLLKEKRELVILVEDFAVLAGIQGPLLDAMIQEAVRDGQQELCLMRSAIAVTEGKLPETVKTRAHVLWSIKSEPFKDEVAAITWYGNFVGGFLNAARHGQSVLKQKFSEATPESQASGDWIPRQLSAEADEDTQAKLSAFGNSAAGIPLFPFNHAIIEQFLRRQTGGVMAFKPRGFINGLLRTTLINHRVTWMQKQFPPRGYLSFAENYLAQPVAQFLRRAIPNRDEQACMLPLAFFWGGNPRSEQDVQEMPAGIFEAFNRPQNFAKNVNIVVSPPRTAEPRINHNPEVRQLRPELARPNPWELKINAWRETRTLTQGDANAIRTWLVDAYMSQADPDSELLKQFTLSNAAVNLPWVTTGNAYAFLVVLPEAEQTDQETADEFFGAIAAVTRYHTNFSWDYDGGEMDAVRYAAFIGKLVERWTPQLVAKARGEDDAQVVGLGTHLLINARILNLKGAASKDYSDNLAAILDPGPSQAPHPANTEDGWSKLQNAAANARGELRTKLLERVGARQGGAATVHAIDPTRLLEGLQAMRKDEWVPPQKAGGVEGLNSATTNHLKDVVGSEMPRTVQARRERLGKLCKSISENLGEDSDVEKIKQTVYETVNAAKENGVFSSTEGTAESLTNRFKDLGPIKTHLGFAQNAIEDSGSVYGPILSKLAEVDSSVLERLVEALKAYDSFLTATTRAAEENLKDAASDVSELYPKLQNAMEQILESLTRLN
jgi:hypothetical protein